MERLTKKDGAHIQECFDCEMCDMSYMLTNLSNCKVPSDAIKRLASFEDAEAQGRLVIFDDEKGFATGERLAEIMLAEHDRRLVVLPCKIGSKIYMADGHMGKVFQRLANIEDMLTKIKPMWGKVYFATPEEATAALKTESLELGEGGN